MRMRAIIANFLRGLLDWLATENVNNQLGKLGLFTPGHLLESTTKPLEFLVWYVVVPSACLFL